jgi:L-rhamnose mutarotase
MIRIGQFIHLSPGKSEECEQLRVELWPGIDEIIRDAKIRNYTIFQKNCVLFAYFEYQGPEESFDDYMEQMWNAPRMQEWLATMRLPIEGKTGQWWEDMQVIFQQDMTLSSNNPV